MMQFALKIVGISTLCLLHLLSAILRSLLLFRLSNMPQSAANTKRSLIGRRTASGEHGHLPQTLGGAVEFVANERGGK